MIKQRTLGLIPNLLTLTNLYCGSIGVVFALEQELDWAVYMIWACAVLDVSDGLAARALGVSTKLGKQLDSLADLVAFGLLPAAILYTLSVEYIEMPWPIGVFLITVFSAIRLARFNLDPDQEVNFKGLPTPANAILISSFPHLIHQNSDFLRPGLENQFFWFLIVAILSYLLVSRIPLMGFKFENYSWTDNKYRYIMIASVVLLSLEPWSPFSNTMDHIGICSNLFYLALQSKLSIVDWCTCRVPMKSCLVFELLNIA